MKSSRELSPNSFQVLTEHHIPPIHTAKKMPSAHNEGALLSLSGAFFSLPVGLYDHPKSLVLVGEFLVPVNVIESTMQDSAMIFQWVTQAA